MEQVVASSGSSPPKQRYTGHERLASGGVGVVYRVLDRVTGEPRALKRLSADGARHPSNVEAFEREYQVLAGLDHPRIIRVFDYGIDDEGPYYTMELVGGSDIRNIAPVGYVQACLYLRDVATSLALLHARRLIHRDVSPRNVRVTEDNHAKLLDFGALASFGPTSIVVGTPPAIPPEALEFAPLDQHADLYALGALAYWLLTGRHAYPAKTLEELPIAWATTPRPPSAHMRDVPKELDALVLALLQRDPRARPASAAEVIARLNVIGELADEDTGDADRFAASFLLQPRFTGRAKELDELEQRLRQALLSRGGAVAIQAMPGMGRTRLLEEIGVRARLTGATVLRVDASMHRQVHGTARALALALFDAVPETARPASARYRPALAALGAEVERRLPADRSQAYHASIPSGAKIGTFPLEEWFVEVSREKPLVVEVDNAEEADHPSLGILASLAKLSMNERLLVLTTEKHARASSPNLGLAALHSHSTPLELSGLSPEETLELVRSLFGDAPNVERFADFVHERTLGSPLYAVEICRRLVAEEVIRYSGGLWTLPVHRPDAHLPEALEEALSTRIQSLSDAARSLAECLSLQREAPTFALCKKLAEPLDERQTLVLLDELSRTDVLWREADGLRFSSSAIRDALLQGMDSFREEENHGKLGAAFAALSGEDNPALRIQAGFHLIRGGHQTEGADLIALVAGDSAVLRTLMANLHHVGDALEAALLVYRQQRRTDYECMPLLAALAQAGYYEQRVFGERYGDEALNVLEVLSGMTTARFLRRFCGRWFGLMFAVVFVALRFYLTPKRERRYSFASIFVCLLSTVTTLAATASLSLNPGRATRLTDALEPFSMLPERLTPVGIYQFCRALQEIGRDNEAYAFERFDLLLRRFEDPRYYPTLPADGRALYVAATHFARATFGIFRADGRGVLESARALDATGLKLYTMIASQLRYLYRMNRGEFAEAEEERVQVELHAAHVGSIWQVETWESPALILLYTSLSDVVSMTRVSHRLETRSHEVPTLRFYFRLAQAALSSARGEPNFADQQMKKFLGFEPRSFIGWGATLGYLGMGFNEIGQYADAKSVLEEVLPHVTDADREFTSLFLQLDLQYALALSHLGEHRRAFSIVDTLLGRFANCAHPLTLGFLHETRARIAWNAGNVTDYEKSLAATEQWFRGTGTPILIARCEKLARLRSAAGTSVALKSGLATDVASVSLTTLIDDFAEEAEETWMLSD